MVDGFMEGSMTGRKMKRCCFDGLSNEVGVNRRRECSLEHMCLMSP